MIKLFYKKIATILQMIKFEHTIFALPFAYMGAFLAEKRIPTLHNLFWITIAMFGARSLAMSLNRLIDIDIDSLNPRTKDRALPAGILTLGEVILFSLVAGFLLVFSSLQLSWICRYLWPAVVVPFVVYPYTKRFTYLSHFVLGFSIGLAPVGAWVAVTGVISLKPVLLGMAVALWIGGFDIIYACQDLDFDRSYGLHSLPAAFGVESALSITRLVHVVTILLLAAVGLMMKLGLIYFLGVLLTAVLIAYENAIVSPIDLSRVNTAFFTVNGVISVIVFLFTAVSLLG